MKSLTALAAIAISSALTAGAAPAQTAQTATPPMKEEKPGLLAQATVTPDAARKLALAQVANGRIAEQEIEMERGRLAYSFDIKVPRRSGIEEVLIDAKSGALIAHEHEGPKAEAAERAREGRATGAMQSHANTKTTAHRAEREGRGAATKQPGGSR